MIFGNFITEDARSNNTVFGEKVDIPLGYYELLREAFACKGVEINTPDLNADQEASFDLYIEGQHLTAATRRPRYLIALENPNHNERNANQNYCQNFTKVFTWNLALFEMPNVIKVLPPHQIAHADFPPYEDRDIFTCMINANKNFKKKLPSDLYGERISTIRWYEKNVPEEFSLFGRGWEKPPPEYALLGKIKRSIPSLRSKWFGYRCFPSYQGEIVDKGQVLRRSKFSYCYENNHGISNYITEKIIDSFVYGCIPIYWGAGNVLEFIPEDCFIDRRKFRDTEEVHQFLLGITSTQFAAYQANIEDFLKSEAAKKFSFEHFVSTVVGEICKDIGIKVNEADKRH